MQEPGQKQFLEAYDAHAEAIYRHCYFRIYSRARAEELTQETFMRAWQYLADGNAVDNIRALLYRIATNLVIDDVRKRKEESLDALMDISPAYEPANEGHGDIERAVFLKDVRKVMDSLPEDYRDILILRYVDDMDVKDIAAALDITPNNASVRLNRAMKELKGKLERGQ